MITERQLVVLVGIGSALLLALFWSSIGHSEEAKKPVASIMCPADAKSCKVVVLTDEQVATLKVLLENTNFNGPYAQIKQVVEFYKDMLDKAPAGEVAEKKAQ